MGHDGNDDVARFVLDDTVFEDILDDLYTYDPLLGSAGVDSVFSSVGAIAAAGAISTNVSTAFDSSPTITTPSDSQERAKKPMVNSTRQRMKEELAYLRNKVVELEHQLETMTASTQSDVTTDSMVTMGSSASLWERVARHQRLEKQKAERMNSELRLLLEDQLKIAKSLEKVLRKRPSAMLTTSLLDELTYSTKRLCTVNAQDASLFSRLISRVDAAYRDLESVWQRTGLATDQGEHNESQVLVDDSNRLFLEVINAKIVPFTVRATNNVAWKCLSQASLKFLNGVYHAVHVTANAIHSNSKMWVKVGDAEARMNMTIVIKRYFESETDRVVFALEASTVSGGAKDVLHSLRLVERGWVVFQSVKAPNDISDSTLIQVCMRLSPVVNQEMTTASATTGAITNLILAAFHQNLNILYQAIENMLVEQMLNSTADQITVATPSTDVALSDTTSP